MDIFLIVAIFSVVVLLFLSGFLFVYRPGISNKNADQTMRIGTGNRVEVDRPRRAQIIRNQRSRLRAQDRQEDLDEEPEDSDNEQNDLGDEKIGAKKRAKLEAKAEKKALREVEEKVREEKKKREQQVETERLKAIEKEQNEEKKIEEEERVLREERERIEHEAYLKMKASFSIEEEGYEDNDGEERDQSLQKFISYIKDNKVIIIEDLAVMFKLKTQAAIDRIQDLQKDDILSGVMDDRGKYIYISQEELHSFAKFIKQRGRVSLSELAESSNKLINLQPNQIIAS